MDSFNVSYLWTWKLGLSSTLLAADHHRGEHDVEEDDAAADKCLPIHCGWTLEVAMKIILVVLHRDGLLSLEWNWRRAIWGHEKSMQSNSSSAIGDLTISERMSDCWKRVVAEWNLGVQIYINCNYYN